MENVDFSFWENYFAGRQARFAGLPWADDYRLTPRERARVAPALRRFQRGESSDGAQLLAQATAQGQAGYLAALRLFIKEEQTHASALGRFMHRQGIAKAKTDWMDVIFRWLRHRSGLANAINTLLVAETVSMVFYTVLERATHSPLLRAICQQILVDEEMHLRFQVYTRRYLLHPATGAARRLWHRGLSAALLFGSAALLLLQHGAVFRAAGYDFYDFIAALWLVRRRLCALETSPDPVVPPSLLARAAVALY
jgi:hypothetical protein